MVILPSEGANNVAFEMFSFTGRIWKLQTNFRRSEWNVQNCRRFEMYFKLWTNFFYALYLNNGFNNKKDAYKRIPCLDIKKEEP
jgi:hypothetical protein